MLRSRTPARLATLIAGLVVAAGLVTVSAPGTAYAIDSPSSLHASDAPIPVLSWDRVPAATGYDVQVSRVADFTDPDRVPRLDRQRALRPVASCPRSTSTGGCGPSADDDGDLHGRHLLPRRAGRPVVVQPLAEATFTPPQTPRFTWEPVAGATNYTVQTAPIPPSPTPHSLVEHKQKTTAAYLTGYPEVGTYYWRVGAELSTGYATAWSPLSRYHVDGLRRYTHMSRRHLRQGRTRRRSSPTSSSTGSRGPVRRPTSCGSTPTATSSRPSTRRLRDHQRPATRRRRP